MALGGTVFFPGPGHAQVPGLTALSAHSSSGQFVVSRKGTLPSEKSVLAVSTNRAFVRLEPATLAVSAERVKQALWEELEIQGDWRGKIHLSIRAARTTNDPVVLGSERLSDGWRYGLELPEVLDRPRYLRAMSQCLLLEIANRGMPARSAEIPAWLVEGLSRHLLAGREAELVVPAPQFGVAGTLAALEVSARREDPLQGARQTLVSEPALDFQRLSWPSDEDLSGARGELYRASSQLFVAELQRLPGGRSRLRQMLAELPGFYNWQFAFLKAFEGVFARPLDVEKWWALQVAHFTGRNPAEAWGPAESWLKLDEVLGAPAQVRVGTNELPQHTRVTLQSTIRDWNRADQLPLLRTKLAQLESLRLRSSPDIAPLIGSYQQAVTQYLEKRARLEADLYSRNDLAKRRLASQTVNLLDELDARRNTLRPPQS